MTASNGSTERFGHDIIVVGASAGGVEALMALVGALPADLPAAVFVVLHVPPNGTSALPALLNRAGPLPAAHGTEGEPIRLGRVYVAPPDYHLMVDRGRVRVLHGPRENRHRPAVDTLFRSAARAYGPRTIGVVLTGALDDGTAGLLAVKRRGGLAVVQDPADALIPSMPESALRYVDVDHVLPLRGIAPRLACLARETVAEDDAPPVPHEMEQEVRMAEMDPAMVVSEDLPGTPSSFTCPECTGPLYEIQDGQLLRFRCRTGHAFNAENVLVEQGVAVEEALYVALSTLEQSALMSRRLAADSRGRGHNRVAERFEEKMRDTTRHAETIRRLLERLPAPTPAVQAGSGGEATPAPVRGAGARLDGPAA